MAITKIREMRLFVLCVCFTAVIGEAVFKASLSKGSQHPNVEEQPKSRVAVSIEQLLRLRQLPNVAIIDVRARRLYTAGHIPGAICVPFDGTTMDLHVPPLSSFGKSIGVFVVYCSNSRCSDGATAIARLRSLFPEIDSYIYPDGWDEWRSLGLPISVENDAHI